MNIIPVNTVPPKLVPWVGSNPEKLIYFTLLHSVKNHKTGEYARYLNFCIGCFHLVKQGIVSFLPPASTLYLQAVFHSNAMSTEQSSNLLQDLTSELNSRFVKIMDTKALYTIKTVNMPTAGAINFTIPYYNHAIFVYTSFHTDGVIRTSTLAGNTQIYRYVGK